MTKEAVLKKIKTHIEQRDRFFFKKIHRFAEKSITPSLSLFLVFVGLSIILAVLKMPLFLLTFSFFCFFAITSFIAVSLGYQIPKKEELVRFKKALSLASMKYSDVKPFLSSALSDIQQNCLRKEWYEQLFECLQDLKDLDAPEDSVPNLEDVLLGQENIQINTFEKAGTVKHNSPSAWKI